jgi:hypothetical protein
MEGWYSTRCKLTWKLKGTKYSRLYFQLVPSTLPTEGIGFGLLPTPAAQEPGKAPEDSTNHGNYFRRKDGSKINSSINLLAQHNLLPTPQAIDGNGTGRELRLKKDCNRDPNQPGSWRGDLKDYAVQGMLPTPDCSDRRSDNSQQWGLSNYAKNGMLPTPAAEDNRDRGKISDPAVQRRISMGKQVGLTCHMKEIGYQKTGANSQLNPRFVAEMMGFPPNWLELPFQSTETNL